VSKVHERDPTGHPEVMTPVCTHDLLFQLELPCDPETDVVLRDRSVSPVRMRGGAGTPARRQPPLGALPGSEHAPCGVGQGLGDSPDTSPPSVGVRFNAQESEGGPALLNSSSFVAVDDGELLPSR
jgi:hypothetical protein